MAPAAGSAGLDADRRIVLIEVDDRILLIQEAKASCAGKWFLPGGRLEHGESLAECARREVREEAGLDGEPLGLLYVDQLRSDGTARPARLRFVLRAKLRGGTLKSVADSQASIVPCPEVLFALGCMGCFL